MHKDSVFRCFMSKIAEYKKNFIETRVADDKAIVDEPLISENISHIGKYISDMDIAVPDAAHGIFDKIDRPILIVCDDNIEYVNNAFLKALGYTDIEKVLHEKFLKFVSQDDWNFIAENIGDILTSNGVMELRMLNTNYKVIKMSFDTVYLEDTMHFCFILMGRPVEVKVSANAMMYDEQVGLPKFYLYEYSVQSAIDYENHKNPSLKRNKIAVCGIAIKNFTALKNDGQAEFVMQRIAEKLLLSLNKLYTVAVGSKYQFWILMPDMQNDVEIIQEIEKIQALLNQPVANTFAHYDVSVAIGVSIYPDTAQSAKKLIAQSELAIKQALKDSKSKVVYFGMV